MLESGGVSLEDIRELKYEEGLMKLIDERRIPSPDAVGVWLRRMGKDSEGLKGLGKVREKINHRLLKRDGIKEYTLDADATEIIAEKDEANYTYKGNKGYMPMLGFLYETKLCIYDEFREGNTPPAYGQKDFYTECKKRMPREKKIKAYRADSASYQAELINRLEEDGVKWGITASHDKAVKALINSIEEAMWNEPERGCGYELAETVHCMNKTGKSFRMVLKRELRKQADLFEEGKYYHHVIATNWLEEEKTGNEVIKWHNQRGDAENFNKELKSGFGMERMPCGQTHANAVFFRLGVIAYNLFIGFKRLSCPDSWARHTIKTFRWKMIQAAGRIVSHAGQVILKLAVDIKKLAVFEEIRVKIYELSLAWDG
ncbi:transposase [Candidatus Magnetominusculus xianensis]|uniref:Transposase n=2 Tax=Candidatus Magnetominusculus xianensis TaxID=1748249 RepID=A0ABR5SC17_9BACT|nr:transposase [Candidatus Magnetominusculus xianensis]